MNAVRTDRHMWRRAVACGAMLNLGYMSLWLQPAVVGELTTGRGLSVDLAGLIATVETLMVSGVLLLASRWKRPIAFRATGISGLFLTAFATLLCLWADNFLALLACRMLAALGFGLMLVVPNMALAAFERPDLMFGRIYTLNLIWSAGFLYLLPFVAQLGFGPAVFVGYLLSAAVMTPLFLLMPRNLVSDAVQPETVRQNARASGNHTGRLAGGAAAVGLAYGLVWAFFVVLAGRSSLSTPDAITASSLSLVGAFLGSALASQSRLFTVTLPLFRVILVLGALSLLCLTLAPPPKLFVAAGMLAMFAMYFHFPTVLGAAGKADPSGRSIALINGSLSTLSAIGPFLGGMILSRAGPLPLGILSALALFVGILIFETFWRRQNIMAPLVPATASVSTAH